MLHHFAAIHFACQQHRKYFIKLRVVYLKLGEEVVVDVTSSPTAHSDADDKADRHNDEVTFHQT